MKRTLLLLLSLLLAINVVALQTGEFADPRDGKTYKTVKIGDQIWMAENLAYKTDSGNYWAYDNKKNNLAKYGYLYNWQTSRNVCPTGWHLPTDAEWTQLTNFLGNNPGARLKSKSGWYENGNGTDDYGFSACPGGVRDDYGKFRDISYSGVWWSSTENGTTIAWSRSIHYSTSNVSRVSDGKELGFSVRCVRD